MRPQLEAVVVAQPHQDVMRFVDVHPGYLGVDVGCKQSGIRVPVRFPEGEARSPAVDLETIAKQALENILVAAHSEVAGGASEPVWKSKFYGAFVLYDSLMIRAPFFGEVYLRTPALARGLFYVHY